MGYRSALVAVVYSSDEDALTTYMARDKLTYGEDSIFTHFKGQLKRITIPFTRQTCYALVLEQNDVKWYPDYPEVVSWHRFMEEAEEHDLSYEFIRIGENSDDIENLEGGDVDGLLYTVRNIERDYPQPTKEEIL
jgi:hypothetical protein